MPTGSQVVPKIVTDGWIAARKVTVIGAGTMGSGIAAHLSNLGFEVTLLDLTRASVDEAFNRAKQAKPPHFYTHEKANNIRVGSIEENLEWVSESDWVCEAIIERMDAKKALFAELEPLIREDAMITTNTSGLQISLLTEGRSESFKQRFIGTHFFNPPRYLKLLELIPTEDTDPGVVKAMTEFLEQRVARRVVLAKDTPGFIANRYGMWAMFNAIHVAERLHLSVEQVDAITGPFLGRPRSASFRLNDLVGLDIMVDIAQNLIERCPEDHHRGVLRTPTSVAALIEKGWMGDKSGQGYYKREGKEYMAIDLQTYAYRLRQEPDFATIKNLQKKALGERISEALTSRDEVGEYLRNYLVPTLQYADYLKEEISHNVQDFDRVMMWGFGWEMGPFAMIDAIGHEKLGLKTSNFFVKETQLDFSGKYVKLTPEPQYVKLQDFKVISETETYVLRDLGDGVKSVGTKTKMGVITPQLVDDLTALFSNPKYDRLVLAGEGKAFSVGFDLNFFVERIAAVDVDGIDLALRKLQKLGEIMEQRSIVAAVHGFSLGAGHELALSCSLIAANSETTIGLPESRVGLIPAGRGTALMRIYNQGSAKRLSEVAMTLTEGLTAPNPEQAKLMGLLRPQDVTVFHPDGLINAAKKLAMGVMPPIRPSWASAEGPLVGMIDQGLKSAKEGGRITDFDQVIGEKLKQIFAKSSSYDEALSRERSEFLELCFRALTQARIKHMLEGGKPLRN